MENFLLSRVELAPGLGSQLLLLLADQGADGKVTLLPDGAALFSKAMGLDMDLTIAGMGPRCQRFALIAEDGKVTWFGLDERGAFDETSAETVMAQL